MSDCLTLKMILLGQPLQDYILIQILNIFVLELMYCALTGFKWFLVAIFNYNFFYIFSGIIGTVDTRVISPTLSIL